MLTRLTNTEEDSSADKEHSNRNQPTNKTMYFLFIYILIIFSFFSRSPSIYPCSLSPSAVYLCYLYFLNLLQISLSLPLFDHFPSFFIGCCNLVAFYNPKLLRLGIITILDYKNNRHEEFCATQLASLILFWVCLCFSWFFALNELDMIWLVGDELKFLVWGFCFWFWQSNNPMQPLAWWERGEILSGRNV